MPKQAANPPVDVEPINDPKTAQRYLRYAVDLHEAIACVVESVGSGFTATASSVTETEMEIEIDDEDFRGLDAGILAALDTPRAPIRLTYSVNEVLVFAHAKIKSRTVRKLKLELDFPLCKLQRRDALRIKTMQSHHALLKVGAVEYGIYDISASGLGIVVPTSELPLFPKGEDREDVHVIFAGLDIRVRLKIMSHHRSKRDGNRWKIGFRFVNLPAAMENRIAQEAYLQTHRIWSRWI